MDRCPTCNYALSIHFRPANIPRAGQFIGCPQRVSAVMGHAESHPRVSFRVITARGDRHDPAATDRKGHTIATWADYQAEGGDVLVWDLSNGDQWMAPLEAFYPQTRKATSDEAYSARDQLEHEIGGPIRIVNSIRKKREQIE